MKNMQAKYASLAAAIRLHGFDKLAHEVMRQKGEYVPADGSLKEATLSITMKMARNKIAHTAIREGIESLRKVREL